MRSKYGDSICVLSHPPVPWVTDFHTCFHITAVKGILSLIFVFALALVAPLSGGIIGP